MIDSNFFNLTKAEFEILTKKLMVIAISKTKNMPDAQDIVQITLEKAIKSQDSFDGKNLNGWLVSILKNSFFDFYRKEKGKNEVDIELLGSESSVEGGQTAGILENDIENCLNELSEVDREIMAHVQNGEPYSLIADFVSLNIENIKIRVCRSRSNLRLCLDN